MSKQTIKRVGHGRRFQTPIIGESMTVQSEKDSCDINILVRQGAVVPADINQMTFSDLSEIPSYSEAVEMIAQVEEHFMSLPSKIRNKFENDPQQMLDFVTNPENIEESIKLGLISKDDVNSSQEIVQESPQDPVKSTNPSKTEAEAEPPSTPSS